VPAKETPLASLKDEDDMSLDRREDLGARLFEQRKYPEAIEQFRIAYELRKQRHGPEANGTLMAQNNLGAALIEVGQNQGAFVLLEDTVAKKQEPPAA